MSEQLRSLRHERDLREHGAAVTTRPWWNTPGEESREQYDALGLPKKRFADTFSVENVLLDAFFSPAAK